MKDGFIKIAAVSPATVVADTKFNTNQIKKAIDDANEQKVNILLLPELCVTSCTCGDLFYSDTLLTCALEALKKIKSYTADKFSVVVAGLPLKYNSKLYNCAAVIANGSILGITAKENIASFSEYYNQRQFTSSVNIKADSVLCFDGENIPFSNRLIFCHSVMENYSFGIEIGEDLFASVSPASELCANGANIILNPSSSNETTGKAEQRKLFIKTASAKNICAYITSNASMGEATGDTVFSAHNIIAENGSILCESAPFEMKNAVSEIDVNKLSSARVKSNLFRSKTENNVQTILFEQEIIDTSLSRKFAPNPFVPENKTERNEKIETILKIQAFGLKKRLEHARSGSAVIGISGGLDSCLALLATVNAYDLMKADRKKIIAVTMPCFGTSERTHDNAVKMCESLGVTLREVNIKEAVNIHFRDIEHSSDVHDVTYENAQARERTQVLMDIANKENGMVIGTGDLSELALGWATYNGDHMSMYSVNADITKTMVRHIVQHIAENSENALKEVLLDILDTPVSPELLPTDNQGKIAQKTEDLVGPYELHDFFLYHHIENAFSPSKIYRIAKYTFDSIYDSETILKWLKTFMRRFFIQQFKRSCLPDGPKVGSVSLSPRGDWNMPSDASFEMWIKDLDNIR